MNGGGHSFEGGDDETNRRSLGNGVSFLLCSDSLWFHPTHENHPAFWQKRSLPFLYLSYNLLLSRATLDWIELINLPWSHACCAGPRGTQLQLHATSRLLLQQTAVPGFITGGVDWRPWPCCLRLQLQLAHILLFSPGDWYQPFHRRHHLLVRSAILYTTQHSLQELLL